MDHGDKVELRAYYGSLWGSQRTLTLQDGECWFFVALVKEGRRFMEAWDNYKSRSKLPSRRKLLQNDMRTTLLLSQTRVCGRKGWCGLFKKVQQSTVYTMAY